MATRTPISVIAAQLGTTATTYTVPANSILTISAGMLNNSTGTARTVSATVAGLAVLTALTVPAGAAPVSLASSLVGQTFPAGTVLSMTADAGSAVTCIISGYLQQ